MFRTSLICALLIIVPGTTHAEETLSAADRTFFETKIRPVLVNQCYECHSAESGAAEGGLRLDTHSAVLEGGGRGPAVVPGKPEESWLLTSIAHGDADLKMPPKKPQLSAEVIADFSRWIAMGAPDPRVDDMTPGGQAWETVDGDFWAYQPPKAAEPPKVDDATWSRSWIDPFILARLEEEKLSPSPEAEPSVLLRRVYFDLIGLPPSPEELDRFVKRIEADGIETALAAVVDGLLDSPRFGERWGRHWLDVARFGESSGTEANISFPYAWRYRDYVIDRVNEDLPFNQFLTEQIAGDLLPYENNAQRAQLLIATGFLALGPKNLDATDERQFQADVIDEQIDTVSRAVLANSIACARCHDHKFEPFSMEDYYALAGIFKSTKTFYGTAVSPANRIGGEPLKLPEVEGQKILHQSLPQKKVEQYQQQLAELKAEKAQMDAAQKARFSGKKPEKAFSLQDALRNFWTTGRVVGELNKVSDSGAALPLTMGVLDAEQVVDAPIHQRGDINKPGEVVPRRFPHVLRIDGQEIPTDQSGRLELAQWLTDPRNPLTARVLVNRVWHHLLGAGLVSTIDNFGSTGEPPSHGELLDTLAVRFVDGGWSLKQLVREIVLSRAYRQASDYREEAFQLDPENRLLWRVSKRRLEAEAIRDAMLAVSGEIDFNRPDGSLVGRVIGDRPISLIGLDKRLPADLDGGTHRSVYLPIIRDRLPDVLDLFDFAEPSLVTGDRETTNVPTQALYLLNSPFVQARAAALATRLQAEQPSAEQRAKQAFLLCFSRQPDREELARSVEFLTQVSSASPGDPENPSPILVRFCQALLCTGEFRNLD
ncbi:MAG: PSD1 and planctomycete cytochrome C domain-containing protein [Pirellulaceae bacterium]